MYKYPYGDSQQLNLDWIIAKLKELEASGGSGGADLEDVSNALISLTYNTSTAYRRYDYAFLNGKLYRCLSDTSGVFDPSAWQEALIGDDLSVLTRWINAIDAAAVVDVKFDTSGTNGKIQQKYHDHYHNVVEVDYTPVQNSKRPLSSNAGYELNGAITSMNHSIMSWDVQTNGKILFLSNSYGNLSSQNWQKFPYWCATYLGLGAEGTNWWNCSQPYFSLAHPDSTKSFKKELQDWVSAHASEKANIGAVVVVGGINDSRPTVSGESYARYTKVLEKFEDLISYIKTNLPNATAYCGYTGWIDLVARPSDDRRGAYRLKVAQSYMKSTQYGWKYLNGIENIIHNKNYLADGIHPNEAGAKRLGLALAEALSTGSCEIIEWSTTIPTAPEGGSVGSNAKARERQQNGIINTQFNALQFGFASNTTVNVGDLLVAGNINLNMSTGVVEFGNQTITLASYASSTWTEHGTLARIFIADNGNINLQIKAFFDGSTSKTVRRVTSFTISESHAVYADDTWNNTIDGL